ncbi:hypothetical protein AMBLS11_12510 [Alteromonas macleodii str. 'Black Sea 11']|nr:hypothetical protein AMBLS11_12510 [Alteromonas macleodii str. 'Black Sea 11']
MDPRIRGLGEIVTLCLAREMARVEGRDQAQAVKRCARKVRERVGYYPELKELAHGLVIAKASVCLHSLKKVERNLRAVGVL